ncbi:polysaccharide biosynthesis/export family protein [Ancylobacter defluvii]|uniref:Capsular polysaccharide biosynthesis protein n=1 Tax=Ancylobacter defluvii TaxID=1282440 RepID=A0A9W6JUD6_9HYPH|nr:polysaccharide biosynthesis/export family protein [Ancylobacter defluvii]MBS7588646.1 polysaccharide export protein [Ancylobacter defluvii]GLK83926.1 capsular polysaccharide biosynthesis protein [Ancylobacter defluvii]
MVVWKKFPRVGVISTLLSAIILTGCSMIPSAGPNRQQISDAAKSQDPETADFLLLDVNNDVLRALSHYAPPTLEGSFGNRKRPSKYVIGVGDSVTVTIWEGAAGGLFSRPASDVLGTGSQSAAIPEQQVSKEGDISVPFAGRIIVAGKTTDQVEQAIVEKLTGKAIEPQVLVVVSKSVNNAATVIGEVNAPGRVPLSPRGERILDVIALAGGNKTPAHETFVVLDRNGASAAVPLQTVIGRRGENVFILPDDTISLIRDPQTFTAFGAATRNAQVPFDAVGISLAEALAKAGGLIDNRADPQGVYLMRFETEKIARVLKPDYAGPTYNGYVRVIYKLDMREANGILLARDFLIRNKDAIYISNAPISDLNKVLSIFSVVASPVSQATSIANGF